MGAKKARYSIERGDQNITMIDADLLSGIVRLIQHDLDIAHVGHQQTE